ncbi:class I SAM-dependent methyltransferase [Pyramidobacter piscolens]|uniref:class I SAM-dependent methyltransferase n=1 Tax=Pyramidobacter piscolens TaxID=638849 RepID=UPI0026E01AAE|nr:class I SAM-dependent methyltransferase [Pyramidobacter piscolens]
MNEIKAVCIEKLSKPWQDMEKSNAMWNKRAREFRKASASADDSGVFEFFKSRAELKGRSVIDVGCGAGRYLKRLLDEGALAEGLEPSVEMAREARDYLSQSGYDGAAATIRNVAFQDFAPEKKYDYVFISNSPVISYYENYAKIVALPRRGLFISSWLRIQDLFLEKIAAALGREAHTHGGCDIVYFLNLLLADGYCPDFWTNVSRRKERVDPENFYLRYASWLYGPEYDEKELDMVKKEIDKYLGDDKKVAVSGTNVMGMLYLDLRK